MKGDIANDRDSSSDAQTDRARQREAILREESRIMREDINAIKAKINKMKAVHLGEEAATELRKYDEEEMAQLMLEKEAFEEQTPS